MNRKADAPNDMTLALTGPVGVQASGIRPVAVRREEREPQ